jgi:dienelactone hydrolase
MKKQLVVLLAVSLVALMGFGCDSGGSGSSGGVCTENVSGIARTSAAKLYYPCNISSPLPATTMSSGWTAGLNAIEWLSSPMAAQGYIVLAFTPANTMGMVEQWEAAHKNTHSKLLQLNSSHAKLKGKIDTAKMQISGYSKGGGGSLAAAAGVGGGVRSVVAMAPYCGGEYSMNVLRNMKGATFIQCGGVSDTLARPAMTRDEYESLPNNISKAYKRHSAWGHLEWATGGNQGTIKNEIFAWMNYYLKGNTSGASYIENRTGVDSYEWVK